jgi:hypothetical protein
MDHYQHLDAIENECKEYITPELCDRLLRLARNISTKVNSRNFDELVMEYSDALEREYLPHSSVMDNMIYMMRYYLDGKFADTCVDDEPDSKRVRFNPKGQNMYLDDTKILSEEKSIVDCQRIWSHNAYKPGGYMYNKAMEDYRYLNAKDQFKRMNV